MNSDPQSSLIRTLIFRGIIALVFIALGAQLWRLQINQGQTLSAQADQNRFRSIIEPADRGVVYDVNGRLLARNRPSFSLSVIPAGVPENLEELDAQLDKILDLLLTPLPTVITATIPITPTTLPPTPTTRPRRSQATPTATATSAPEEPLPLSLPLSNAELNRASRKDLKKLIVNEIREARLGSSYLPLQIASKIPPEVGFTLREEQHELPGVIIDITAQREYLTGALTSDIIGYMGPIPADQLDAYRQKQYSDNEWVGYAGVERSFEQEMRGISGYREIQVDVTGREISTIGQPRQPTPGQNLVLTIDIDLQKAMEQALRRGLNAAKSNSGVAIALNPQTGAVLGLVSFPTYDNNLFADGITESEYATLSNDKARPLLNHAISGIYPPGSTFKIVPASGALQDQIITERTRIREDNGIMWLPNKFYPDDLTKAQPFYCWIRKYGHGHGLINVTEALAESCDTFFYQIGGGFRDQPGLTVSRLADYARMFGFGETTGIDLPGEHAGLIPNDQWKRLTYGESWVTGDTYNMAIGQGFVLATPLQVANSVAAVANGGTLYRPQLVARVLDADGKIIRELKPETIRTLDIKPEYLAIVREGMFGAVNWAEGTAPGARVAGIAVAGKTGTAEFWDQEIGYDAKGFLPTHAWFTAFAPFDNPQIALVVFIYNGGEGSAAAVPVASEIMHYYFKVPMPPGNPYQRLQIGD